MAGGYALVTGKAQGVLVHVDVGTANCATAMHNLFRSRIPVLLMAGKAPFTTADELLGSRDTYVHFIQEPFDQGSLVRPYVKWEWTLPSGVVVKEAMQRARSIMESAPKGPVYLMLPREILTEQWRDDELGAGGVTAAQTVEPGAADPDAVDRLARRLLAARHPVLIASYAGRDPEASLAIDALSRFAGIAVFDDAMSNIAHDMPCYVGALPEQHLAKADVGLIVDMDVPWIPKAVQRSPAAFWAQIDVDALKGASPLWNFPADLRLQGSSARILRQVLDRLQQLAGPEFRAAAAERVAALTAEQRARRSKAAELASTPGTPGAINVHYLCAELGKLLAPTDLVFNEAVRNAGAVGLQIERPIPGTLYRNSGGGLGASCGLALGAKLAAPGRLVVNLVGDGTFYFNNPTSVFAVSQQYELPILTVVLDNAGWSAVKHATLQVYPRGDAHAHGAYEADLPQADLGKVAEAFGAHAERLSNPQDVPAALARAVEAVRAGRSALVHARVTPL
jgi:acetolactate synthase-1/2/3 large subunit